MSEARAHAEFSMPLLPPSVNHYVSHGGGFHRKTEEAKAFERDFPIFSQRKFAVSRSGKFAVTVIFTLGPGMKGDVDNRNKCLFDCIARAGMLRDAKGKELSDAWIKRAVIEIHDSAEDRQKGPRTDVTIEAWG